MLITCPHCGYSKDLSAERIPADATSVCCPKCREKFPLRSEARSDSQTEPGRVEAVSAVVPPTQPQPVAEIDIRSIPKAGFWLRVVATFIDVIIVITLQLVLGFLLGLAGVLSTGQADATIAILVQLFGYVLSFAYYVVFTGHCGQTPGKMALRIKVVRCDGTEIGYGRAALREIPAKFIASIILCIGYLMVAFDEQKQGLHDRMVDTYVIKL